MKGNAQEVFSFTFRETPVEEVLGKIEQQTGYIFSGYGLYSFFSYLMAKP